jgi:hypothetical protein
MERNTFALLVEAVGRTPGSRGRPPKASYTDRDIVLTYLWAVLHDRPVSWACRRGNWPFHDRTRLLPSSATMSRRLRSRSVVTMLETLEGLLLRPTPAGSDLCFIDAKPLVIGGNGADRDARFGRAAGTMAKGYKLHLLLENTGRTLAWEVHPMSVDERPTAVELLRRLPAPRRGMLLADSNYDAGYIYDAAAEQGMQLVTPPRFRNARGHGHRPPNVHRMRGLSIGKGPSSPLPERAAIERRFGNLGNQPGGLGPLPNWVRSLVRVRRWVAAKLMICAVQHPSRRINVGA